VSNHPDSSFRERKIVMSENIAILPVSADYVTSLRTDGRAPVTGLVEAAETASTVLARRSDVLADTGAAEFLSSIVERMEELGVADRDTPHEAFSQGFPFQDLYALGKQAAQEVGEDDDDHAAFNALADAVETAIEWGSPTVEEVQVNAAERTVEITLAGSPDDVAAVKAELESAADLDAVAEICIRHQTTLAQSYGWNAVEHTPCCERPGFVPPEGDEVLNEANLGGLAIIHTFERPSDEEPLDPMAMLAQLMGGGAPGAGPEGGPMIIDLSELLGGEPGDDNEGDDEDDDDGHCGGDCDCDCDK
jgi:hypothetical protein